MIKLSFLDELVKLTLYSSYIKGEEQPISLLICANAESAKSETLKKCVKLDKVLLLSDATAFEILKDHADDIIEDKVHHILIPDLIPMVSKRWETSSSFIAFLNMLIAEGIIESCTFALHRKFKKPVKCGLIACITPSELQDKRHRWVGQGFLSRLLPVSWSYSETTKVTIFNDILQREYRGEPVWGYKFPHKLMEVNLSSELAGKLLPYTYQVAQAEGIYGFRYQKHLQRLAMSSAVAFGRDTVLNEDIEKVIDLSKYLNLSFTAI